MNKKILIGIGIAAIIVIFIVINIASNKNSSSAFSGGGTYSVTVQKIEKGSISSSISASGVIEEVEKAEVYFDTPLKVKKIWVNKNQKVEMGQKVVDLDLDDLNSQLEQAKISKTTQALAIQKINTLDATKSISSLENNSEIAENNAKSAERNFLDSQKNYEDTKALYDANAVSKSDLERAKKTMDDASGAYENAKINAIVSKDSLADAKKANQQSASSKEIDLQTQQKNLEATQLKISELEKRIKKINEAVISPVSGVVAEMNIQEGSFTSNMQASYKIINPDKLRIKADVKEFDIKNVAVGQSVTITGDAIDKNVGVTGKVESISTVAKKNRTTSGDETLIEVTVAIDNANPVLKPGLSVTCAITTQVRENVLIASFNTLNREDKDGNKLVYVVDPKNNILHEKHIKLGVTSDLNAEVTEGLKEGDLVVIDPQPNLKDGSKARITKEEKK